MPQPKAAPVTAQSDNTTANQLDVATAIRNVVSPSTEVTKTSDIVKQDKNSAAPAEDLAPKSEATTNTGASKEPLPTIIELRTNPAKTEMAVGEKRQVAVEVNSDAPLGLTVISLRFDPNVIKVNSLTAGNLFASAAKPPTITQLSNEKGVLMVSITLAAGSQISGEGSLLNLEIEAIGNGDSSLSFDLANVHLVTTDGRATVLQLTPMSLVVKPTAAASAAKPGSEN